MEIKNETPSKSTTKVVNKVLNPMTCDSPFRLLPNVSTPPSRYARILNPFEQHLIERLHLPTFSPSVFAQISTPKTDEKFKWTIDNISSLKPADIDEDTVSQHVDDHDPTMESLVQEKINKFFNEKSIVPSPYTEQVKQKHLSESLTNTPKRYLESGAQTVLTLPPMLPKHVEEALAPYFTYTLDQQKYEVDTNSSLYRKLFEFEEHSSHVSSPPPDTSLSPIQFSPEFNNIFESTTEMPELRDCTLSPIGRSPQSRSACRLSFSQHMSIDPSVVVPDINKSLNCTNFESNASFQTVANTEENSSNNWDMEYNQVSILSQSPVSSPDFVSSSNSNTPHSKMFTSQRKRLSHSFKNDQDVEMEDGEKLVPKRLKNRLNLDDVTDGGYHTGGATLCDESSTHMFASTPTKSK